MKKFDWCQKGDGYECSSAGDKRFSAFFAKMPDGRTIEQHYQCDVKGYQPGGIDWKLGKGRKPVDPSIDSWSQYLILWTVWAMKNVDLMFELKELVLAAPYHGVLQDQFANGPVNQARALAEILNAMFTHE